MVLNRSEIGLFNFCSSFTRNEHERIGSLGYVGLMSKVHTLFSTRCGKKCSSSYGTFIFGKLSYKASYLFVIIRSLEVTRGIFNGSDGLKDGGIFLYFIKMFIFVMIVIEKLLQLSINVNKISSERNIYFLFVCLLKKHYLRII